MELIYKKSESTIKPELVDSTSSKTTVYLRKNIVESKKIDEKTGDNFSYYKYEEAKLTKEEYKRYLKEINVIEIQKQREEIDNLKNIQDEQDAIIAELVYGTLEV